LDFWDITKVLGRYWRLSIPMLLATVAATVLTVMFVHPYYVSTAYVQLVPPIPPPNAADGTPGVQRNPWLVGGPQTLGNAALVPILDPAFVEHLKATGYSGKYTAIIGGSTPLVTIMVTGTTPAEATASANQIVNYFDDTIDSLQASYSVDDADLITARRLDSGTNVTVSSGRVKRYAILVGGLGVVLGTGLIVGGDLVIRRRARRADELAASIVDDLGPPPTADRPTDDGRRAATRGRVAAEFIDATRARPTTFARAASPSIDPTSGRAATPSSDPAIARAATPSSDPAAQRDESHDGAVRAGNSSVASEPLDAGDDATMVLPKAAFPKR
jgi:capsular polysaccharide biosynthesis protein